jgi:hypothetical protein
LTWWGASFVDITSKGLALIMAVLLHPVYLQNSSIITHLKNIKTFPPPLFLMEDVILVNNYELKIYKEHMDSAKNL